MLHSGHLDMPKDTLTKKFEIWKKMGQWKGGHMFWFSQNGVVDDLPRSDKYPPPPWLKLSQIENFLIDPSRLRSEWLEKVENS